MSLYYNSLFYYYHSNDSDSLSENTSQTYIIHLTEKNSENPFKELEELAQIEDLSYFLLKLMGYSIQPFNCYCYDNRRIGDSTGAALKLEKLKFSSEK